MSLAVWVVLAGYTLCFLDGPAFWFGVVVYGWVAAGIMLAESRDRV